jgi:Predicted transcriptional regulators
VRVADGLEPFLVDLAGLRPDPANPRRHPERNLEAIVASLERFGQLKPVVALADRTVVAGNGTLEAARRLGWPRLAAVILKGDDAARARAYALADNRTAELAEWDGAALIAAVEDLEEGGWDVAGLGFEPADLKRWRQDAPDDFPDVDDDLPTDYRCPGCGYEWSGKAAP